MALYWLGYAIEQRRDVKCVCRATSMASSGSVCVCSVLETLLTEQVLRTFYVLFFFPFLAVLVFASGEERVALGSDSVITC